MQMTLIFRPSRFLGFLWKIKRKDWLCRICGWPTTEGKLGERAVLYCEDCEVPLVGLKECAWFG